METESTISSFCILASNNYEYLHIHTSNALYSGNHLTMACWSVRLFAIYSHIFPPHQQASWQIGVVAKAAFYTNETSSLAGPARAIGFAGFFFGSAVFAECLFTIFGVFSA